MTAATVCLHKETLAVTDSAGNDLQVCNIVDVTFTKMVETETDGEVFAYIVHDRRLDSMYGARRFTTGPIPHPSRSL